MELNNFIVNAEIGLRVRSTPDNKDNKNIIDKLSNGKEVVRLSESGKWYEIEYKSEDNKTNKGWVYSDFLVSKNNNLSLNINFPDFKVGIPNFFNDSNTKKVREIINDEFGGDKNKWDLQCTEYVCYKIRNIGIIIKWPVQSGRHGGKWADIFLQFNLYKILENPISECAMCFTAGLENTSAKDTGHVAFVEKIFDDGSISISEANWPGSGKYNERKLPKSLWQNKYKARFVDFK